MSTSTAVGSVAGVSSLNSLLKYTQSFAPKAPPKTTVATAQQTLTNSTGSILASTAPTDTALYGAVTAPSTLYSNIATLASLNAVNAINELGTNANGKPTLLLGNASQAAAAGVGYQQFNQLTLVEGINSLSSASNAFSLPSSYLSSAYKQPTY